MWFGAGLLNLFSVSYVQITTEELTQKSDALSKALMYPWWMNSRFADFKKSVSDLLSAIEDYKNHLEKQLKRTEKNHASPVPVRSLDDHWGLTVVQGKIRYPSIISRQVQAKLGSLKIQSIQKFTE